MSGPNTWSAEQKSSKQSGCDNHERGPEVAENVEHRYQPKVNAWVETDDALENEMERAPNFHGPASSCLLNGRTRMATEIFSIDPAA